MKRNSCQEDEAVVKQWNSQDEEPVVMEQCADQTMTCPGLDHPGQNKEERPKHDESIIR